MRNTYTNKIASFFKVFSGFIIAIPLLIAGTVQAVTMYSAGSLLQPNDVTSSHIRDNNIVNVDINSAASILLSKLHGGGTAGLIPFSNGSTLATSTALSFATTTSTLTVTGGLSVSATTTLNGVAYQWPNADGSNAQGITTNGAGQLAWSTLSQPYISTNFTAGETIGKGNYLSLGDGTNATTSNGSLLSAQAFTLSSVNNIALSVAVPASDMTTLVRVRFTLLNTIAATTTPTIKVSLRTDSAGSPGTTEFASSTITSAWTASTNKAISLNFTPAYSLATSTTYWVVVSDTANTNAMQMYDTNGGGFPSKTAPDGVTWSAGVNDLDFNWVYTTSTAGYAYKANSTSANYRFNEPVGFAVATTTTGQAVSVANYGFISGLLSGLSVGQSYFLTNTSGVIGTSAGTNSLKVGQAVATSTLVTRHP